MVVNSIDNAVLGKWGSLSSHASWAMSPDLWLTPSTYERRTIPEFEGGKIDMVDRIVSQCLREGVEMVVGLTDIKGEGGGAEFCRRDGDHSLLTRIEKIDSVQ